MSKLKINYKTKFKKHLKTIRGQILITENYDIGII